jgi:hypothetical protein
MAEYGARNDPGQANAPNPLTTDQVQAIFQAIGTGAAAAAPQQQQVQYAISPAAAQGDQLLDYSSVNGIKIFKSNTEPLDEKFDLSASKLKSFLDSLDSRVTNASWRNTLMVTQDNVAYYLISSYGILNVQSIRQHALNYAFAGNRNTQNAHQLYVCLERTLTIEARTIVTSDVDTYTLVNPQDPNALPFHDGLLFFKTIIMKSIIDTNATIVRLHGRLTKLPETMKQVGEDISAFNNEVQSILQSLLARGQMQPNSLLTHLFDGYESCSDHEFHDYIKRKKESLTDGALITPQQLMNQAENKYKQLKEDNLWKSPTNEEKQIIALSNQVDSLNKINNTLKKRLTTSNKGDVTQDKYHSKEEKNVNQSVGKFKRKFRISKWMRIPPDKNEPHSKRKNNRT